MFISSSKKPILISAFSRCTAISVNTLAQAIFDFFLTENAELDFFFAL